MFVSWFASGRRDEDELEEGGLGRHMASGQRSWRGARWMSWHGTATCTLDGPVAGSLGRARASRPRGGEA
jgi:hypothetical protein